MARERKKFRTREPGSTKDKFRYNTSQLLNFTRDSYLERTSRPIYAIVFLLPFILFYELCIVFSSTYLLDHSPVSVVTFVWLQKLLASLGFGGKLAWVAPPLVVVIILIALQVTSGKRWNFWPGDVWRMAVECVLLAVPLIVLVLLINTIGPRQDNTAWLDGSAHRPAVVSCSAVVEGSVPTSASERGSAMNRKYWLVNIATGIGAGIYEELIFRLVLICLLMLLFQDVFKLDRKNSIILSVLISAALFSAHHHIDFLSGQLNPADPFNLTRFVFRTLAGVYFAVLFAIRGFGITAGTHAFYNIITVSINARFFQY
jgi:membrane protease YdiL (CAAX protease family)